MRLMGQINHFPVIFYTECVDCLNYAIAVPAQPVARDVIMPANDAARFHLGATHFQFLVCRREVMTGVEVHPVDQLECLGCSMGEDLGRKVTGCHSDFGDQAMLGQPVEQGGAIDSHT